MRGDLMSVYEKNPPTCECEELHSEVIEKKRTLMPNEETLYDLSDFFKIFGDSTRMSILFAIDGEPMCVCDIAELLGMTKSAVSHQLKILRQSDLITYKKSGKNVFYTLADDHVRDIIEKALEHIKE
jgi:ArsR family transcriptional regulator